MAARAFGGSSSIRFSAHSQNLPSMGWDDVVEQEDAADEARPEWSLAADLRVRRTTDRETEHGLETDADREPAPDDSEGPAWSSNEGGGK